MLLSKLFHFVMLTTSKFNIDESHGLSHSMNVLMYANRIFESELPKKPQLINQERLIYVSSVLHDMCDKKYMSKEDGIEEIECFLNDKLKPIEIETAKKIISTMSYSTVKKNGFPDLQEFQSAYHIVREADLLTAYDFDRSMIYNMYTQKADIIDAFRNAKELFTERVLKHNVDKLFFSDYAKQESARLYDIALQRIWYWHKILELDLDRFPN